MLDHYLRSAYARRDADRAAHGAGSRSLRPIPALCSPSPPSRRRDVVVHAEDAGILPAVRLAAEAGLASHAWQLAWIVSSYFLRRGSWEDNTPLRKLPWRPREWRATCRARPTPLHGLALGYARSGRFERGRAGLRARARAVRVDRRITSIRPASTTASPGSPSSRSASPTRSGTPRRRWRSTRPPDTGPAEGMVLNDLGFCHARLGNFQQALGYCERGLAISTEVGERNWEAATLDSLGFIHDGLGDHGRAVACYEQAAAIYRELGDRFNEADTLVSLGDIEARAGASRRPRARAWADCPADLRRDRASRRRRASAPSCLARSSGHGPRARRPGPEFRLPVRTTGRLQALAAGLPDREVHDRSRRVDRSSRGAL